MDDFAETVKTPVIGHERSSGREALLVHIYPTGPEMGTRYVLGGAPLTIGRAEGCDIRIRDHSVSRRHAVILPTESGYAVTDLGSLNGTCLNDRPITAAPLQDGDYLRVGNCIYRFLMGGNVEAEYHEEIYRLTIIDALTNTHNKRYLLEFLDRELARSQRCGRPLSLVLLDIDDFKAVNDQMGHLVGDSTLRELAACLRAEVRREELLARYGGEEFAVVLPETTSEAAATFAERARGTVATHEFRCEGEPYLVTISLGVASTLGEPQTSQELIRRADEALYQAKSAGKNCVRVWQPSGG